MTALAGDLPGFEEALRVLYARDRKSFKEHAKPGPPTCAGTRASCRRRIWSTEGAGGQIWQESPDQYMSIRGLEEFPLPYAQIFSSPDRLEIHWPGWPRK